MTVRRCADQSDDSTAVRGPIRRQYGGVRANQMMERLPYLAEMGFTALELMPIHEFNELEYYSVNPARPGEFRYNFW
eukprot:8408038-Pyramimonas_sp.AAC.1